MQYSKPACSFEQQADLLLSRGLEADRENLIEKLKNINYYRLSGYLYPYRAKDDKFLPGTTMQKVWRHYTFDRRLRFLTIDAIERIEVSIKTQIINNMSKSTGALGYEAPSNFPGLTAAEHAELMRKITSEVNRSREKFVEHFKDKYGDTHQNLPLWMAGEVMPFGCAITMYRGIKDKNAIAAHYGVPADVLDSWLRTILVIRNICAHHGRLWNRELGVKPYIPKKNKYPLWHDPVIITQNKMFGVLTILKYLMNITAPNSKWKYRLSCLFGEYPDISLRTMGFPEKWQDSALWK